MQKKSLPKLKEIPVDIIQLMESDDTASLISEICLLNGVGEEVEEKEEIEQISYQIARVLLGALKPQLLANELETKEGFLIKKASVIAKQIENRVFSQVKKTLDSLYEEKTEEKEKVQVKKETSKIPESPPKEDRYREPL